MRHHEIDADKWDDAVVNSLQSRIYAQSAWLNHMSPGWEAVIYRDYDVVMPLTVKRKYGLRFLSQPAFTQQLGVFAKGALDIKTGELFFSKAMELFSYGEINVNGAYNRSEAFAPKKNYVLWLGDDYPGIRKNYSESLVKNSLNAIKEALVYETDGDISRAVDFYRDLYQTRMGLMDADYARLKQLATQFTKTGNCFVRSATTNVGETLAISLFFKDRNRIYNICSATSPAGRTKNANYFLYDQLIREFARKQLLLDFEGSNIPGVEQFYKKWGATLEPYYTLRWNRLKWPLRLFKK